MRNRLGLARTALAVVAVGLLAACGPDASSSPSSSASAASTAPVLDEPATDFGSAYVGQPVAFWFWAPY